MPLYKMGKDRIEQVTGTTFSVEGLKERTDLQRLLRTQIDIVSPDTLVIAEEFGEWDESHRRIDLLGLDKDANLVVIELKRGQDGSHMELQALRYAAMISTMTFEDALRVYSAYLQRQGQTADARTAVLNFLGWAEPDEDRFAQDVRIVLVSADFSKEVTTTVLWLAARDLDIRCVRLTPYRFEGHVLIDVEQVIPLPEAAEYQIQVSAKARQERQARASSKDYSRFDVTVSGSTTPNLPKRRAILRVVQGLVRLGIAPSAIAAALAPWKPANRAFWCVEGTLDGTRFLEAAPNQAAAMGRSWDAVRYFTADSDLIHADGRTYAFSNQWGGGTEEAMQALLHLDASADISLAASEAS